MSKTPGIVWLAALGLFAAWRGPPALGDPPGQPGALDTSSTQPAARATEPPPGLVRLNADGTRDAWFNQTGTVTVTPTPPGKPSDPRRLGEPQAGPRRLGEYAGGPKLLVKVSGTDAKKKTTTTTTRTFVAVKARLKTRSKAVVWVRAVNAARTSAQTCTTEQVK